jgi:hypothetical protein
MAQEIVGVKIVVDGQDANKQTSATVGNIRRELKEANAELIAAQRNFGEYSKEAVAAAKRVAQLRDAVQEARETADLFDPGKKFQAFSGAINAVAGGFTAVQGALGLVGVESAEVEKQLLKVQSALALSQGLSTITDSAKDFARLGTVIKTQVVTAFSTLRGAIVATGVGALVVGLGLLAANFEKVRDAVFKLIPGLQGFINGIGRAVTAVTDFIGVTSEAERGLESFLAATAERNKEIDRTIKLLSAQGGKEKEIAALNREQVQNQLNDLAETEKVKQTLSAEELDRRKTLQNDLAVIDTQETARLNKQAQDRNKAAQDAAKQRAQELAQARERELEIEREYQEKIVQQENQATEARLKLIDDSAKILQGARDQAFLNTLQGRDRELAELDLKFQEELERFGGNLTARNAIEEAFAIQRAEINAKFDAEDRERTVAAQAEKIAGIQREQEVRQQAARDAILLEQQKTDAIIAGAREITNVLGGLTQLVGRNTAAAKVLNIAQATIDTYASVASVFAQAAKNPATIPFPAYPYIQAGAALVAGLARVRAITSVQVPFGGGGGGSAPGAPAGGAAPIPPAIPLTQTVTQLQSGTINQLQSATTRAYVVESDVTGAQERIRRINRAARLG